VGEEAAFAHLQFIGQPPDGEASSPSRRPVQSEHGAALKVRAPFERCPSSVGPGLRGGLGGLTIGGWPIELKMKQKRPLRPLRIKRNLQLATMKWRGWCLRTTIVVQRWPTRGLPRLWGLCDGWLACGGPCFLRVFVSSPRRLLEFDSRTGPVRDAIAAAIRSGYRCLRTRWRGNKKPSISRRP